MLKTYSPISPRKNNWIPPKKKSATISVGMPWRAFGALKTFATKDQRPAKKPNPETVNPPSSAMRAGALLVLTKPLIAWSVKAMKLDLDFPFLRTPHVYGTEVELLVDCATKPRI